MKAGKWFFAFLATFAALLILQLPKISQVQLDFNLRHNEICASHERIDPFRVWDGQVESEKYIGRRRPDRPQPGPLLPGQRMVHAYPPWHTTFFYFYGWIPNRTAAVAFKVFNLALLAAMLVGLVRFCAQRKLSVPKTCFVAASVCLYFHSQIRLCIGIGNYGVLLAALAVLLFRFLDRGRQVPAGIVWALMMIKPQVSALLFWPLLFGKCYRAILVAAGICFAATLFPAWLYGESPLELVLQVPRIGAPYCLHGNFCGPFLRLARLFLGEASLGLTAAFFFLLGGLISFPARHCGKWWEKTIPAMIVVPYWTYAQRMDWVIAWNVVLATSLLAVGDRSIPFPRHLRHALAAVWFIVLPLAFATDSPIQKAGDLLLHGAWLVSVFVLWRFQASRDAVTSADSAAPLPSGGNPIRCGQSADDAPPEAL